MGWLKQAAKKLDPKADEEINAASRAVEQILIESKGSFDLDSALASLNLFTDDIPQVVRRTYRRFVVRAWKDLVLTEGEAKTLRWIAEKLRLSSSETTPIQQDVLNELFISICDRCSSNGEITPADVQAFQRLHEATGAAPGEMFRNLDSKVRSRLFNSVASKLLNTPLNLPHNWTVFCGVLSSLGIQRADFLSETTDRVDSALRMSLADATADGFINDEEEQVIKWIATNLASNSKSVSHVLEELDRIRLLQQVDAGVLPSIQVSHLGLRAGEIVHAVTPARYWRSKKTKAGIRQEEFSGSLTITDSRLIFASEVLSIDLNHRKVVSVWPQRYGFNLESSGKGSGQYELNGDPELLSRIFATAVRRANQTITISDSATPSRHIPRDVRQRVWQTYGGKCVDCGATDYLEFDHIVPVNKGGSNAEKNVQLLCRRCNSKKSDHI